MQIVHCHLICLVIAHKRCSARVIIEAPRTISTIQYIVHNDNNNNNKKKTQNFQTKQGNEYA